MVRGPLQHIWSAALRPAHELRQQPVKVMYAVLAPHGVAPARVCARAKAALHGLADAHVLNLNLVAELDGLSDSLLNFRSFGVAEVPLEDCERALGAQGDDEVRRVVVGVDVKHQVWEDPEVERRWLALFDRGDARGCASRRRVLNRVEAARLGSG